MPALPSLPLMIALGAALAADGSISTAPGAGPTPIAPGRTTRLVLTPDLGAPVERAVPGRAFARAVGLDAEQRWSEAAAAYQDAITEWTDAQHLAPSPALDRAVQKAERERQRSALLASTRPAHLRPDTSRVNINPLEEGRLLRGKVMVVRATRGAAPPDLATRARRAFEEASRGAAGTRLSPEPEIRLQLCALRGALDDPAGARLERAHVTSAERHDPENGLALALCAAALGEDEQALGQLETYLLRPAPHPTDPFTLRDIYLANDWDRLRGKPRFESLFNAAFLP